MGEFPRPRSRGRDSSPGSLDSPPVNVTHVFDSVEQYANCYRAGTEFEVNLEREAITKFNEKRIVFPAWVFCKLPDDGSAFQNWIVAIKPTQGIPSGFPDEGEKCSLALCDVEGITPMSRTWSARRVPSPHPSLEALMVFKVFMPVDVAAHAILHPVWDIEKPRDESPVFDDETKIHVLLHLEFTDASGKSELGALDMLMKGEGTSEESEAAFQWLTCFKNPGFRVNLFDKFPHMHIGDAEKLPPRLRKLADALNPCQREAYEQLLSDLPCGVGIVPGGPGGGKTRFNLFLTAMAHAKPIVEDGKERRARILYLLDINRPIDDTTTKCIKMAEELGEDYKVVRMFGWHREWKRGLKARRARHEAKNDRRIDVNSALVPFLDLVKAGDPDDTSGEADAQRSAPTLDYVAFKRFEERKDDYAALDDLLQQYLADPASFKEMPDLKGETFSLYNDVLDEVSFLASTPVAAATYLCGGRYKPDLILFDEAPHASELSCLIAIAHFTPAAWIFTGDFRQTGCFLGSGRGQNPYEAQMRISMMERAFHAGVCQQELLMNHRAFGNLSDLPSELFYANKMVTGHDADQMFPSSTRWLCSWLSQKVTGGQPVPVPRVLIHARHCKLSTRVGSSFFNESHMSWVMGRVRELIEDKDFQGLDGSPGTILVIAPYKEAFIRYKAAAKALHAEHRVRIEATGHENDDRDTNADINPFEARTIDAVQGHESDVVFIDLVRERATTFLDDGKRLAVATTRARQAEIYLMQPSMYRTLHQTRNLVRIYEACRSGSHGQVSWVTLDNV